MNEMNEEYPQFVLIEKELKSPKDIQCIGYIKKSPNGQKHQSNLVYGIYGISPTICGCDEQKIVIKILVIE